jgi:adenylylsulfate kinase
MKVSTETTPVIWLCGLSGAGKTTLANAVKDQLKHDGIATVILDADKVRKIMNSDLGYTESDRIENIRRAAAMASLLADENIVTLNTYITPSHEMQNLARNIVGLEKFIMVYVNAPLEVCEKRDIKGMYALARQGKIKHFTGISAPFEAPNQFELELHTDTSSIESCVNQVCDFIKKRVKR